MVIVFCMGNAEDHEQLTDLPFYMLSFLKRKRNIGIVTVDLEGLR